MRPLKAKNEKAKALNSRQLSFDVLPSGHLVSNTLNPSTEFGMQVYPEFRSGDLSSRRACSTGISHDIWMDNKIVDSFCRCPDGSYGFTCSEGFSNPCHFGIEYAPADSRLTDSYFVKCDQNLPFLFKCANGLIWDSNLNTCNFKYNSQQNIQQSSILPFSPSYPQFVPTFVEATRKFQTPTFIQTPVQSFQNNVWY
jgi:hypothetical protein